MTIGFMNFSFQGVGAVVGDGGVVGIGVVVGGIVGDMVGIGVVRLFSLPAVLASGVAIQSPQL